MTPSAMENDGDDEELQEVHVDRADGLDPFLGERAEVCKGADQTCDNAERHTDENLNRQTQFLLFFHKLSPFLSGWENYPS